MAPEPSLAAFYGRDGRIAKWPAKRRAQLQLLALIADQFESGRRYRESEVNEVLDGVHSFGDASGLRRALCDWGFVGRERDGSAYWLITADPPALQ